MDRSQEIKKNWDERAALGDKSGTNDLIAKQCEVNAIMAHVSDGMKILEVGCGTGGLARRMAAEFDVEVLAVDYSEEMIKSANAELDKAADGVKDKVRFQVGNVLEVSDYGQFDLVITERVLINLQTWEEQGRGIEECCKCLAPGGKFVMCEASQDGLDAINELRTKVGLDAINSPWHNRYLREDEISQWQHPEYELVSVNPFSATYYLFSRVVNAWTAKQEGNEPDYNAPVNSLALELPPIGEAAQTKIWLWQHKEG